jgi:hypothetical protein
MQVQDVPRALSAIKTAWEATCHDYGERKLNSERALQSAFYYRLRSLLEGISNDHVIFIEATVILPPVEADEASGTVASESRRVVIDTLVCKGREILVAIELKYTPQFFPDEAGLRKDLTSLSEIRNHTAKKRQVRIELPRHRDTEADDPLTLTISPDAKMLMGIYCADSDLRMDEKSFWKANRPESGPWGDRVRDLPPKLGLCFAYAFDPSHGKKAEAVFMGEPFRSLTL